MPENFSSALSGPGGMRIACWLALAGVVGPILFVTDFTVAGFLHPGYSPVRQSISTLGVGTNAWLVDGGTAIFAVLLLAFAISFFLGMRQIMRNGGRVACLVLLILASIGIFNAAIFTAAPGTAGLHWTIGFLPAFLAPVAAYLVASWQWRRVSDWRGDGWYSLATALAVAMLIALSFVQLAPRSASGGPSSPIGGLIERILVLVTFAWPVVIGWRLFVQAGFHQRRSSPNDQQREPEQQRMEVSDKR